MIVETVLDGSFTRFALAVTTPFLYCISLVSLCSSFLVDDVIELIFCPQFFCAQLIGNIGMMCARFPLHLKL